MAPRVELHDELDTLLGAFVSDGLSYAAWARMIHLARLLGRMSELDAAYEEAR